MRYATVADSEDHGVDLAAGPADRLREEYR
jgi:hypothetical protein